MDEICIALSKKLSEVAENGYTIFFEDELLELIPENTRNRETLEAALKLLTSGGYIDVKYARGNAFCITSLKQYLPPETPEETAPLQVEKIEKTEAYLPFFAYILVVFCAFFGGLAGSLIGAVL